MALRATFIGINKYLDPGIRDLTGARRDATALWALFCDTMPQMEADATLLVDEQATVDAIRAALDETLGAASADDTVIVSFSGHGSHDHRVVAADTDLGDLAGTTIPMSELAERFRASAAKVVLFVLDCCFSGGAPARVLEDSPIPRNPAFPLQFLAGEGRILIAASKEDEESYELPGTGHGLLTKALLTALQPDQDVVDLTAAMTHVMESVRAEAARIGVDQTPVMLGYIQGGLTLPGLRPSQRFFDAFPEARGYLLT